MMTKIFGEQKEDEIQNRIFDKEGMKIILKTPASMSGKIEDNSIYNNRIVNPYTGKDKVSKSELDH